MLAAHVPHTARRRCFIKVIAARKDDRTLPKGSPIEVTYSFDASGRIAVAAREKASGRQATIDIQRRGGLNQEQLDAYTRLANEYTVE